MLNVLNIHKSFNGQEVLKGINLRANNGELTIVEGQNGAGKSTLFSVLSGAIKQEFGTIDLSGQDISNKSAMERSKILSVLVQDPKQSSVGSLTVLENCALALLKNQRAGFKSALNCKDAVIKHLVHLKIDYQELLIKKLQDLSGGQRQMFAFAMATINRPQMLLLDEPTAALDEKSAKALMELVKILIKDWQIPGLMISHDRALNQAFADRITYLEGGQLYP